MRESTVALLGAAAVLVAGAIDPASALAALAVQWNVFLFFLGLMSIAAIADQSGLLEDLVEAAAGAARGRADVLFLLVCAVALIVTVTLTNDATVLLLTPLVVDMAARLRLPVLPYAYACALLANAGSVALPIANPANVLVLRTVPIGASEFIALLATSAACASLATIVVVFLRRRVELAQPITMPIPNERDAGAGAVAIGVALIVCAYLFALELRWPVGIVAVCGAAALITLQAARGFLRVDALRRDIAWGIFPLLAGLVIVVHAAEGAGLVDVAVRLLADRSADPSGIITLSLASAALANLMNNLPWALLASSAAQHLPSFDPRLAASLLVGIDVGPNFTTFGSLATLLWIVLLRRRGIEVTSLAYARAAFLPSAAALGAAILPLLFYR